MSTTIVTALYDIGRDHMKGEGYRPFSQYLDRFRYLLALNAPMIIFADNQLRGYLQEHRLQKHGAQTRIVYRSLEELSSAQYLPQIKAAIENLRNHQMPTRIRNCPEYVNPHYAMLMFSKFDFLRESATINPFGSEYFIWLDAGTFYAPVPFDENCDWPDPYKMRILGDRFLIQNTRLDLKRKIPDKLAFCKENRNDLCGYIMGGNRVAIERTNRLFFEEVRELLAIPAVTNDQNILHLIIKEHAEDFLLWERTKKRYPRLQRPLFDRMLPYELAAGTKLPGGYPLNSQLRMLTLATREVAAHKYRRWETTAKYYGYQYEIMGRDQPWKGFGTKIRSLYQRLLTVKEPYVAMTDCTDAFFAGSADEMLAAFLATGKRVVVGGEMYMAYPKGRCSPAEIKAHFEAIKESPQCFPNSGFLIGNTADMIELMKLHLDYEDDQGPCFDTIFLGKFPLAIDYRTAMVGNVPNYGNCRSEDYYEFDSRTKRYRSKLHGTAPQFLHFAGRYFNVMNKMYAVSQRHLFTSEDDATVVNEYQSSLVNSNSTAAIWIGVICILLVIFFLFYALYALLNNSDYLGVNF